MKRYIHGMLLCNNTPRAVQAYTWGEAANYEIGYGVKGCRYEHNQQHPRNKPSRKRCLTFLVASSFLTSANAGCKNDNKSNCECNPFHLTTSTISDGCKANKFGRMQRSCFGLDWACGRTCNVEKGHGPLHRPAFPRGIKSSCGRPGACQSKAI